MNKLNRKTVSPPPLLRRPAPTPYFHPLFLFFQNLPNYFEMVNTVNNMETQIVRNVTFLAQ